MVVATGEGSLSLTENVRAFKASGEEEVGKRRKEERVRSKSKREVRQGSNQSGDGKPYERIINKQLGNHVIVIGSERKKSQWPHRSQQSSPASLYRRSNKPYAASQAACAPSNRRNNQAQVSATKAAPAANTPQVSAASGAAPKQQFKDSPEEHEKWVARKEKAQEWMKENSFRGCQACAGFHRLKKSYKGCRSFCPICEMEFKLKKESLDIGGLNAVK